MFNYRYLQQRMAVFFKKNMLILFFILVFFIIGIIFGSIAVNTLNYSQKKGLVDYLSKFFVEVNQLMGNQQQLVAKNVIISNLKLIFSFWILGLTIIGSFLIPIMIFLRGFIVGFTVSFLVDEMFFKGILLALASIFPQNLIILPSLVLGALLSLSFGFELGKRFLVKNKKYSLVKSVFNYSILMLGLGILVLIAGLVEVYLTPNLINLVTNSVIQ